MLKISLAFAIFFILFSFKGFALDVYASNPYVENNISSYGVSIVNSSFANCVNVAFSSPVGAYFLSSPNYNYKQIGGALNQSITYNSTCNNTANWGLTLITEDSNTSSTPYYTLNRNKDILFYLQIYDTNFTQINKRTFELFDINTGQSIYSQDITPYVDNSYPFSQEHQDWIIEFFSPNNVTVQPQVITNYSLSNNFSTDMYVNTYDAFTFDADISNSANFLSGNLSSALAIATNTYCGNSYSSVPTAWTTEINGNHVAGFILDNAPSSWGGDVVYGRDTVSCSVIQLGQTISARYVNDEGATDILFGGGGCSGSGDKNIRAYTTRDYTIQNYLGSITGSFQSYGVGILTKVLIGNAPNVNIELTKFQRDFAVLENVTNRALWQLKFGTSFLQTFGYYFPTQQANNLYRDEENINVGILGTMFFQNFALTTNDGSCQLTQSHPLFSQVQSLAGQFCQNGNINTYDEFGNLIASNVCQFGCSQNPLVCLTPQQQQQQDLNTTSELVANGTATLQQTVGFYVGNAFGTDILGGSTIFVFFLAFALSLSMTVWFFIMGRHEESGTGISTNSLMNMWAIIFLATLITFGLGGWVSPLVTVLITVFAVFILARPIIHTIGG